LRDTLDGSAQSNLVLLSQAELSRVSFEAKYVGKNARCFVTLNNNIAALIVRGYFG